MAEPLSDRLSELERRIAAVEDPWAIMRSIEDDKSLAGETGERGLRYAIARGIVLNRVELRDEARGQLGQARQIAQALHACQFATAVSREIARVYVWRGDTIPAAHEILRAVIEAEKIGSRRDETEAIVLYGQLCLESGRYEAALWVLDELLDPEGNFAEHLSDRDCSRVPVNRCEALAGLGRFRECLDAAGATFARFVLVARDRFVLRLLEVRCLFELGRYDEADASLASAKESLGHDPDSYEAAEFATLEGLLARRDDLQSAVASLEKALDRFVEQDLPRHEFRTRALLIEMLFDLGRRSEAERVVIEALRRADTRRLPALGDQIRTAAFLHWRNELLVELATADRIGEHDSRRPRFLVLETLGSGGFGTVQRAIDSDTGAEVAIKRFRRNPQAGAKAITTMLDTIRNEVRSAARYQSAFVAQTRYLNIDDRARITLVQDFIPGSTLAQALAGDTLGPGRRLEIAGVLAHVVKSLHDSGLAHRDLKPSNIVLKNGFQPVLIDLGLSQLKGLVDQTWAAWTENYAPREQKAGEWRDEWFGREDVYALGKIMFEMVGPMLRRGLWRRVFDASEDAALLSALERMMAQMTDEDADRRVVDLGEIAALTEQIARTAVMNG